MAWGKKVAPESLCAGSETAEPRAGLPPPKESVQVFRESFIIWSALALHSQSQQIGAVAVPGSVSPCQDAFNSTRVNCIQRFWWNLDFSNLPEVIKLLLYASPTTGSYVTLIPRYRCWWWDWPLVCHHQTWLWGLSSVWSRSHVHSDWGSQRLWVIASWFQERESGPGTVADDFVSWCFKHQLKANVTKTKRMAVDSQHHIFPQSPLT